MHVAVLWTVALLSSQLILVINHYYYYFLITLKVLCNIPPVSCIPMYFMYSTTEHVLLCEIAIFGAS